MGRITNEPPENISKKIEKARSSRSHYPFHEDILPKDEASPATTQVLDVKEEEQEKIETKDTVKSEVKEGKKVKKAIEGKQKFTSVGE